MNDFTGLAAAMLAGRGIGDLPPVVRPDLVSSGQLIEVMPSWQFRSYDLVLVHLGNRHMTRALRVFKEFASQMIPTLFPDLPG
jgi:DNA-binding transcriptional LysR family regulator